MATLFFLAGIIFGEQGSPIIKGTPRNQGAEVFIEFQCFLGCISKVT
jgi:hypothetical protein